MSNPTQNRRLYPVLVLMIILAAIVVVFVAGCGHGGGRY
jgi:hypothetical protein